MKFKQWVLIKESVGKNTAIRVYNTVQKSLSMRRALYRSGSIPSVKGWEYGLGGTFFAFSPAGASHYGDKIGVYKLIGTPSFIVDFLDEEELSYAIDQTGVIVSLGNNPNNFGAYAKSKGIDAIINSSILQSNFDESIIWIDNKKLDSLIQWVSVTKTPPK
jgi:hypothetical protein